MVPVGPKDLSENLEALQILFRFFVQLGRESPGVAVVVLWAFLLLLVPIAVRNLIALRDALRRKGSRWRAIAVVAGLGVASCLTVWLVRGAHRPLVEILRPAPGNDLIGATVNAKWRLVGDHDAAVSDGTVRYVVETRNGLGVQERGRPLKPHLSWRPDSHEFEWRVKAVLVDALGNATDLADWSPWQRNFHYSSALERVVLTRHLRVGLIADEERPFKHYDSASSRDSGITIELAELLASALASELLDRPEPLTLSYHHNSWLEGTSLDLNQRVTDVAITSAATTEERAVKHQILFTQPYMKSWMALITRGRDGARALAALEGAPMTSWPDTIGHEIIRALEGTFVPSPSYASMFQLLDDLEVDAIVDEQLLMKHNMEARGRDRYALHTIETEELEAYGWELEYPTAIGIQVDRREGQLLAVLDRVLAKPEIREQCSAIVAKWD